MLRLDHDADAARVQRLHERVGDLGGELFLDLQPPREDIDDPRDFREPDDFAVRECKRRAPCR